MRLHSLGLRRSHNQIAPAKLCGRPYGLGPCALIEDFILKSKTVDDKCFNYPKQSTVCSDYIQTWGSREDNKRMVFKLIY